MITAWLLLRGGYHARFECQKSTQTVGELPFATRMIKIIIANAFALSRLCIYARSLCHKWENAFYILCLSHPAIAKCP
jgi:hypothetical protein